jgi:DNA recombination protein RmuC
MEDLEGLWFGLGAAAGMLAGGLGATALAWRWLRSQQGEASQLRQEAQARAREAEGLRAEVLQLTARLSRAEEAQRQGERQADLLREQLRTEMELLASRFVDQGLRRLAEDSQGQLAQVLLPLREQIGAFERRVEESYHQEARERHSLREELGRLAGLNQQMSEEARNLARALKGDSKVQGGWGELLLSRLLEGCGLREGEEFVVQGRDMALSSEEGRRLQPDVLVRLPEGRHLIVDSKVSLLAYEQYVSAEDETARREAARRHLASVQRHLRELSEKNYPGIETLNSPDFVMLFMPIEPALGLALQEDPALFTQAWDKRVILVSPATLLAALRTVAALWQQERQNQHARDIARLGGQLYDKLAEFVATLEGMGRHLDRASQAWQEGMNRLGQGPGNLLARARKLRDLGAKTRRDLPGGETDDGELS